MWSALVDVPGSQQPTILSLTTGNFGGDATTDEIAVGVDFGEVIVYQGSGERLWRKSLSGAVNSLQRHDIDGDGVDEIFAGTRRDVYALDGRNGDIVWSTYVGGLVYDML